MKKIQLFIIQIFLFSCLIISNSFSKALPPGSGVADVPANVLILLDKSGSMGATSYSGANIGIPYSITPISNTGNYISHNGSTLYGVDHSSNALTSIVGSRNTYRLRQRFPQCSTYYDRGQNVLYHNNHIYFIGKYYYSDSPRFCKVNTTTGNVKYIKNIGNRYSHIGMQKHNDIIFVVANDRTITLHNTATNQSKVCGSGGILNRAISGSSVNSRMRFTVDASGNLVFLTQNLLYKFSRSGMNCPGNNPSYTNTRFTGQLSNPIAMAGHPSNENILYLISRSTITKATLTGSGNNVGSNSVSREVVGRYGGLNPNTYNPTSKSAIRFRSLRDIKIDHALNRIFVSDGHQRLIQTFDLDMNYHGHSG